MHVILLVRFVFTVYDQIILDSEIISCGVDGNKRGLQDGKLLESAARPNQPQEKRRVEQHEGCEGS